MKLLSIAIPCYNSAAYMRKCIDSLLPGGEDVEIIIVNDGSSDNTPDIAEEYRERFPGIVKVVNKENGGHGSAVNTGIEHAGGLYFKVVDSDDWVNQSAYIQILNKLKELLKDGNSVDMFISNFVYEKEGEKRKKVMKYHHALPQDEIFTWKDIHHFRVGQYILMHSVIYRTNLLRECGLKLPEHTFYVDNIFVFNPLPYVKTMYYLDVNFYRYYIGRADQSVNEQVMIGRIDQQIKVNKLMVDYYTAEKQRIFANGKVRKYMVNYLDIITTVSSVLLIRSGLDENLEKKKELWQYIRTKDKMLWTRLRGGILGNAMNLPGKLGRKITIDGYKICQRIFHFN
ncbi:MAG: glycosyltransferase family 2 protein [Lachnospiraceae bacterium]|nr:glycosyltransferase family 2 protein [Lachnospiraceae bacterium]MBO5145584.1 glycosyltransferase family 2 protein [Lachnospiraceae bacterium]